MSILDVIYGMLRVVLLSICVSNSSSAQIITIQNGVNNKTVSYAILKSYDKKNGRYTDNYGIIDVEKVNFSESLKDSIHISALGYKDTTVLVRFSRDTFMIKIFPESFLLDNVIEVSAERVTSKRHSFTNINSKAIQSIENNYQSESVAQLITLPNYIYNNSEYIYIDRVSIHLQTILKDSKDPFRILFYKYDSICKCPGDIITQKVPIQKKAVFGWNNLKLDEPIIITERLFFVAFEVLSHYTKGKFSKGHSLSFDRGGALTYQKEFDSSVWSEPRHFQNRDFYFRFKLRSISKN